MTDSQKRFISAVVRSLLLLAAGPLIKGHLVSLDIISPAIDDLVQQIIGWLLAGGVVGWSLLEKKLFGLKLAVAAQLPAGSSEADVNAVVKLTNPGLVKIP